MRSYIQFQQTEIPGHPPTRMTKELKEEIENDFDEKFSTILPKIVASGKHFQLDIDPTGKEFKSWPVGFSKELLEKIRKIELGLKS